MITMRTDGQQALIRNLEQLPRRITRRQALGVARAGGRPIRDRAWELAPVAPGKPDLRDTIVVQDLRSGGTSLVPSWEVGVAIGPSRAGFYGYYQEFGTVHHAAQPFMRPAFDEVAPGESIEAMRVALWAAIRLALW